MKKIILPNVSLKFTDPIIYCKYTERIELGFPEIQELVSCIQRFGDKRPYLILADVRFITNITREGKRIVESYSHLPFCNGTAILVEEERYECARDFVKGYEMKYPFGAFTKEQDAVDWLLSLSIDC
jgi:hypothetical protein